MRKIARFRLQRNKCFCSNIATGIVAGRSPLATGGAQSEPNTTQGRALVLNLFGWLSENSLPTRIGGQRLLRKPDPEGQETYMQHKNDARKDELEGVAQRLRNERPEASPLELDRIKTTAMSRARAGVRRGGAGSRRLAVAGLTVGLLAAGTGGVIASAGSSGTHGNAATAQYGSNCDTNNGNGTNIGSGNGNKNGNTAFASYLGHSDKGKGKDSGSSSNKSSNNGNENGNDNGNESGNGNNNFNCNENSFNETIINEENNSTTTITNNYNATTITVAAATPPAVGGVQASTTSKKATTSSRHIKIHINVPRKAKLSKVTLKVNGKVVSVLKGKKASANISLVNLPCSTGATTVTITAVTSNGKKITQSHTYHLC
jgi:hypothetical protein